MADITDGLRRLMSAGFRFVHPRDAQGRVVAVTGIRTHHDVVDVVQLFGERDAMAARMPATEPDVLSPRSVRWRRSGIAAEVIEELLHLPEPTAEANQPAAAGDQPSADANQPADRPVGCWVTTRPGRSVWFPASA
jgi:hypothetical protein